MSANMASTAEVRDGMESARPEEHARSAKADDAEAAVRPCASEGRPAGRGIFGPIRNGLVGFVEMLSRYRSFMAEFDALDGKTRVGNRSRSQTGSK